MFAEERSETRTSPPRLVLRNLLSVEGAQPPAKDYPGIVGHFKRNNIIMVR